MKVETTIMILEDLQSLLDDIEILRSFANAVTLINILKQSGQVYLPAYDCSQI